mmetsp:Transcript_19119/g.56845  ORF Transcript_19119/g.56845 Transcript_19119/m.56845 type:complete len:106 (-) Transcript_19119:26-343(-)
MEGTGKLSVQLQRPINPDYSPVRRQLRTTLKLCDADDNRSLKHSHSGVDLTKLERLPPRTGSLAREGREELARMLDTIAPDVGTEDLVGAVEEVDVVISGGGLRG